MSPPYLPKKLTGAKVAGSEIRGAPSGSAAYVDVNQLSGECMLSSDLSRGLFQAFLQHRQRVEGTNES